ncbi:uncharacterized protein [Atheta coriaria]|uniref:uncharacterized protein n=1 Tax=Dalotia coriaria TaxID=877792 RepID=UPI0031F3D1E2
MEKHQILPKFIEKNLEKLGYTSLRATSPAPNTYCVELSPPRKVFIKCLSTTEESTKEVNFEADLYFANETIFYSQLLPHFHKLETTFHATINVPFSSVPVCLYSDSSCLILEDLFSDGYTPADINTPLNYTTTRVVLQQLARFHAYSIALHHYKPEIYQEITSKLKCIHNTTKIIFREGVNDALKLTKSSLPKNSIYIEKLSLFVFSVFQDYPPIDGVSENVVIHGDLWPNNILLKDNTDAKFVDFQGCRILSWVVDLISVILISLDKNTRDEYYSDLFECYRCAMCLKLEELNLNQKIIENTFNETNFSDKIKKDAKYALIPALAGLPLYLKPNQTLDLDIQPGVDPVLNYFRNLRAQKSMKCKNKMLEVIMHMVDYGYLDV